MATKTPLKTDLKSFVGTIAEYAKWTHAEKIKFFAWYLHVYEKKPLFNGVDIAACYEALHDEQPSSIGPFLTSMERKSPKEAIRDRDGYYLSKQARDALDRKYGEHDITLNIREMVKDLVKVIPDLSEQDIFQEALTCLKHDAGRAAVIMVWNIALYHLCQYILKHRLSDFNNRIPVRYAKKWKAADLPVITKYDDFGDNMSEREVIEVANSAGIITGDMFRVYVEKLGKRNSAAHPSTVHVTQVQAEGYIDDLIRNTVLLLPI